jgi:acyl-coenzyme A synthetase/AMP-(fatty) acid ligase
MPLWVQSWGQSEAGPITVSFYTRGSVREGRAVPVTQNVGRALPVVTRLRTVDPDTGAALRRGQVGLIEIRRRDTCLDYVGERDRYLAKKRDGWWNTGDLGVLGRTGSVRLCDREVDRIPEGSAIELEDRLLDRLPDATEVIVLGVDDGPAVPVLSVAGDTLDEHAWEAATRDLPPLAQPVVIPWDEFPRTATWKVQRLALRERVLPGTVPVGLGRWT